MAEPVDDLTRSLAERYLTELDHNVFLILVDRLEELGWGKVWMLREECCGVPETGWIETTKGILQGCYR